MTRRKITFFECSSSHLTSSRLIPPQGATWQCAYPDHRQHEVICHNDVAPYNRVYRDRKPQALIDWDTAGPGPRIWDIAYAVYRFIPLSYAQDMQELGLTDLTTQVRRLRLFSQAYGLTLPSEEILDTVELRLEALYRLLLGHLHDPVYQKMIGEGHLDHYRHDIVSLQHHRTQLEQHL